MKLKIEYVPIGSIKPYEKNPRNNENAVEKVAKSLEEFGWQQPIVIDKNSVIVAGHTRYLAAKKNGYKAVPCVVADNLTDKQIRAYRIADNKTSDFSIWDNKLLLDELDDLADVFTGFDLGDIFDDTLDESDNTPVEENESGVTYEIVVRSSDREKIERLKSLWEQVEQDEEDFSL